MKSKKAQRIATPRQKDAAYRVLGLRPGEVASRGFGASHVHSLFNDPDWEEEFKKASLEAQKEIAAMAKTAREAFEGLEKAASAGVDQEEQELEAKEVLDLEEAVPEALEELGEEAEWQEEEAPAEKKDEDLPASPKSANRLRRLEVKEQRRRKHQEEKDARKNKQVDMEVAEDQATLGQSLVEGRVRLKNEDRRENLLMAMTSISFVAFMVLLGIAVGNGEKVVFGFSVANGLASAAGATALFIRKGKSANASSQSQEEREES